MQSTVRTLLLLGFFAMGMLGTTTLIGQTQGLPTETSGCEPSSCRGADRSGRKKEKRGLLAYLFP